MSFDYKKEYKEYYMPKGVPSLINVCKMNYLAVRGKGNPNGEDSEYKASISLLYAIAFTIKMSYKTNYKMKGYFSYVVPPLEGFWDQDGIEGMDYGKKDKFRFISVIRLPDFVTKDDFDWAIEEATKKKKSDFSKVEMLTIEEGLCVQCMHFGAFDDEPKTVSLMHQYALDNNCTMDYSLERKHHEIYLSDPRKCSVSNLKTVIRIPVKRND